MLREAHDNIWALAQAIVLDLSVGSTIGLAGQQLPR